MLIKARIAKTALATAVLLGSVAMASAATRHGLYGLYNSATPYGYGINSDSPSAAGGGSVGYNQNLYNY
jgi:hypothetical protein